MSRETIDYDPIEELVAEGRRALSKGDLEHAKWCFEEVLSRRDDHPRALLGLSYVLRKSNPPATGADILEADMQVVELVRQKKYVEAIDVVERELIARPGDPVLEKSLAHLRGHVRKRTLSRLGGKDAVYHLVDAGRGLAPAFAALLDGGHTVEEVIESSPFDEDETLRLLDSLREDERAVRVDDYGPSNEPPILPEARESKKPPPAAPPAEPDFDLEVDVEPATGGLAPLDMPGGLLAPPLPGDHERAARRAAAAEPTAPTDHERDDRPSRAPLGAPSADVTGRLDAMQQDRRAGGSTMVPALTLILLAAIVIATLVLTR